MNPIPYRCIDKEKFAMTIDLLDPPDTVGTDLNQLLENLTDSLYGCSCQQTEDGKPVRNFRQKN